VIVNAEDISAKDVAALRAEGARRGWGNKSVVLYTNANPFGAALRAYGVR
jgi:hypothetical protein